LIFHERSANHDSIATNNAPKVFTLKGADVQPSSTAMSNPNGLLCQ